ncbi:uncharacterized protein HMPREF1541_04237 [Cyphellophora europaea CBS 101466]|uniref:RNA helicase n=1 Tax=Cyphellophora europaea (strain CBS 101466) TaxID=1220924 RepID=W2S0P7_CYPE1|nr:uncharacterized protein HMPREF1541_04237 [Cyphellophora europaea CBS 101466]ETN42296.1 hypothetical protein HMPREF1541_04237 [Cyphellophora europaea CBS 101466]
MRKWFPPQSRCLFCRYAPRPIRSKSATRATCATTPIRRAFTTIRYDAPKDRNIPTWTAGHTLQDEGGPLISFSDPTEDVDLGRNISEELSVVKDRLEGSGHSTNGHQWQTFKDEMLDIWTSHYSTLSKRQRDVQKALRKAQSDGTAASYLQCAFIDRVMESRGHSISQALEKVADMRYPTEWYTRARSTQRDIHLHIGPTNSGKTYNALKRLEEAASGFYAGPLRLLAHEVYSRFKAKGRRCDLVTGDDVRRDETEPDEALLTSSTVEMVDVNKSCEVAVIDEIQMMADIDRGWAWTRAFIGSCAKEVHLCGENRVLPLVQELAASMGDNLHVHEYQRLNQLECMPHSLRGDLGQLRPGDAIVCFTVVGIHAMKKAIETKTGRRVAIVYGSLPPETRAQQAALFNDPDNDYDYLVASDAIGMGLNLSIKRVIFETVQKFNGVRREQLSIPQIKQIAGRAGRYRTAQDATKKETRHTGRHAKDRPVGLVTTLDEMDLPIVRHALASEAEPITTAGLLPPGEFVEDFAARLPADTPHEYVLTRLSEAAAVHPRFSLCRLRDQLTVARIIEPVKNLTTADRHVFTAAPFGFRGESKQAGVQLLFDVATRVGNGERMSIVDLPTIPLELLEPSLSPGRRVLEKLEFLHQALILYLWLSYRMASNFADQEMAFHAKEMVEARIDTYLVKYTNAKTYHKTPLLTFRRVDSLSAANKRGDDTRPHNRLSGRFKLDREMIENRDLEQKHALVSDESIRDPETLMGPEEAATLDVPNNEAPVLPIDWTRPIDYDNHDGPKPTSKDQAFQRAERAGGDA